MALEFEVHMIINYFQPNFRTKMMRYTGKMEEFFEVAYLSANNYAPIINFNSNELSLLWFQEDGNELVIDRVTHSFKKNDIVSLTEFNQIQVKAIGTAKFLKWNKHFYCIVTSDSEVGCKGILFYGAASLPIIYPSDQEVETLSTVWKMLELEMTSSDNLQEEMLQMMLKRIIILTTRMYKAQTQYKNVEHKNFDIIREYNFLVEQYFREKHTVAEYAELLFKSPKTLSNLFKKLGKKTPLQFIQDRKLLEARRLLSYSNKTVSEVGYEIGFADVQSFSRFFKKQEGVSPVDFKK